MTAYAFTGPSRLTVADRDVADAVVADLANPTEIITGGCQGWDVVIAAAAIVAWPDAIHRLVLPGAPFAEGAVAAIRSTAVRIGVERIIVHYLPPAPPADAYRRRNETMLEYADVLVAGLRWPTFYRSGEWMTVNIARKAGRPAVRVSLLAGLAETAR